MAEVVTEMQERLLPEYELMKEYQVCTEDQLRECIHKRSSFQTRITQIKKTMRDYLDFILFERKVHRWVCEREEALGTKLAGLKASIAKRIISLYREGLQRFPHEERFWQNFIQFSKKSVPHEVSGIYEKMLTFYADKDKVWCDAGLWTYQYGTMAKVKEIFYRALQRHPSSEVINKTFFDLLLADAIRMNDERNLDNNTKSEQDIGLEFVQVAYCSSRNHVKNINYYLSLLERCEEAEYANVTIALQKRIIDDLVESFPAEELLWDTLAQRELRGFSTSDLRKDDVETKDEDSITAEKKVIWLQRTEKQKIELCCKVYETAVQTLETPKMWTLYINAMLKLNQDTDSQLPLKRKRLAAAFKAGHETSLISDDHLNTYVRLLLASPTGLEVAKDVLEAAAATRDTLKFYELWLYLYIVEKNSRKVDEIFRKAHKKLGVESVPIWSSVIQYYKTLDNTQRLEEIYKEVTLQPNAEFGKFRCDYLEHVFAKSTIANTRKVYNELMQLPPPCLVMQQKMLELELKVNAADVTRLRLIYESIIYYFGKTHPDVWLDFIRFERNGDPKNIPTLYSRAKTTLDAHLVDDFISRYTLLSSNDYL